MHRYTILFLIILLVNCKNRPNEFSRFTQEQIDSLYLDSTKLMQVDVQKATKIDLNCFLKEQSFDFGANVQDVQLISLETIDESLVGNIYKIVVTDSMNYIFDHYKGGGVVIFDRNGKFIKRISPGRGPGELYQLNDIDYDKQNNELLAYQHPFYCFIPRQENIFVRSGCLLDFIIFQLLPMGIFLKHSINTEMNTLGQKRITPC